MAQSTFLQMLQSNKTLVADGATGTNLQARGLPRGVPSEAWLLERPEAIQHLHEDFIRAGADIILTCTFGATPLRLESHGLGEQVQEVNRRAVQVARQAIQASANGRQVLVAGSIGPTGQLLKPLGPMDEQTAFDNFAVQAQALSEAGADLLVLETHFDINEASAALKAARSVSDLPVVLSFSYDRGTRTMMGVRPKQMAVEFASSGADVLGINCGRSLDENLQALNELFAATRLPIWFKPNAGLPEIDAAGQTIYRITPVEMASKVNDWIAAGASIIGGCCGTSPAHLEAISQAAKQ